VLGGAEVGVYRTPDEFAAEENIAAVVGMDDRRARVERGLGIP